MLVEIMGLSKTECFALVLSCDSIPFIKSDCEYYTRAVFDIKEIDVLQEEVKEIFDISVSEHKPMIFPYGAVIGELNLSFYKCLFSGEFGLNAQLGNKESN